ncbi:MAG: alpha-hydroxy-acid oxidizing protein [Thermoanaerobaculia bacterium]
MEPRRPRRGERPGHHRVSSRGGGSSGWAHPILFDGGFRRGTDIFKALALGRMPSPSEGRTSGASRPSDRGVEAVLDILTKELALAMRFARGRDVDSWNHEGLRPRYPVPLPEEGREQLKLFEKIRESTSAVAATARPALRSPLLSSGQFSLADFVLIRHGQRRSSRRLSAAGRSLPGRLPAPESPHHLPLSAP